MLFLSQNVDSDGLGQCNCVKNPSKELIGDKIILLNHNPTSSKGDSYGEVFKEKNTGYRPSTR